MMTMSKTERKLLKRRQEAKQAAGEYLADKGGKVSRKKLMALAEKLGIEVEFEAFGRKVYAFFFTLPEGMDRESFECYLENRGCRVDREYWPGSNAVEITNVSYFKAYGWDV